MTDWDRPAPAIDDGTPSAARMYDYWLGGGLNFAVDRKLADQVEATLRDIRYIVWENRAFVIRSVRHLAALGYDQFVDLGSGLPTVGSVHATVRDEMPDARVVYVDNEAIAIAHGEMLLADVTGVDMINGDLREPAAVLNSPQALELIDFDRPIVAVFAAVMHFVTDAENPAGIMTELRKALPPGSKVVFSHGTAADTPDEGAKVEALYEKTSTHAVARSLGQVQQLVAGYMVEPPGLGWVTDILPDDEPEPIEHGPRCHMYGAILTVP